MTGEKVHYYLAYYICKSLYRVWHECYISFAVKTKVKVKCNKVMKIRILKTLIEWWHCCLKGYDQFEAATIQDYFQVCWVVSS